MALKKINVASVKSITPKSGITNSSELNSAIGSIVVALDSITYQFNTQIVDLLNTLPGGGGVVQNSNRTASPDAFANGVDGANLFIDASTLSTLESGEFFNIQRSRPFTIKEYTAKLKTDLSRRIAKLESSVSVLSAIDATGLTDVQKASIGLRIFEPTATSSPSSLDGKVIAIENYVKQIASDVWNVGLPVGSALTGYSLSGSVQTQSVSIIEWISALTTIAGGDVGLTVNYSSGKPVSSTYSVTVSVGAQTDVPQSGTYNDSFVGVPADLEDDLNQIRTQLKNIKGTAAWTTALTSASPITSLSGLLNFSGTGTNSATNPLGHDLSDFDDSTGIGGTLAFIAGESIAQNQFVVIDSSNDNVVLADATDAAKTMVIGYSVSVGTITVGNPISIKIIESKLSSVLGGTGVAGSAYYIDPTTPGNITSTVPSGSGEYIIRVGIGVNTNDLFVKISNEVRVA